MIVFDNTGIIGNSNEYSTEQVQTVSLQFRPNYTFPLYLVKLKLAQKRQPLTAVRSVKPIVPNFRKT